MGRRHRRRTGICRLGATGCGTAETPPGPIPRSRRRVNELDQQVRVLQRLRELAADSAAAAAKDKVSATASSKDGFSIKSADGKFAVRLKGLVQTDARFFLSDSAFPVTNTFFIRRARPILEATVGKYLEFRLQPDFGQGTTVLFDAYTDVKIAPAFAVRVGKFKPPVDLERLPVGQRHRLRRAGARDQPGAQPRRRPPALGRHRQRRLHLAGRRLQRRARSRQRRRRRERRQGLRRPRLPPAVQARHARGARLRRRRHHRARARHHGRPRSPATGRRGQQTWFRYRQQHHDAGQQRLRQRRAARGWRPRPTSTPARSVSTASTSSRGRTVSRAGSPDVKLKHTAWQTTGSFFLTGEKNSFRSAAPKKPFDPKAGHLRRARAGRALQRAQHRRRHLPDLRQSGQHAEQGQGVGRRAQLVSRQGHQGSWSTTSTPRSPAAPPPATASPRTSWSPASSTPSDLDSTRGMLTTMRTRLAVTGSLALLALVAGAGTAAAQGAPKPVTLLNVSYDPTRELYEDFNAAVRHVLEGEDRPGRHDQAVARRLGQAGPRGHRRPRGRRRHAGAGLRHRRDRREGRAAAGRTGRSGCRTTARPTPRPSCSWCARATPRASRTGTTWSSRASR